MIVKQERKKTQARADMMQKTLELMVEGLTNERIAEELNISKSTVNSYIVSMLDFYNCTNRVDLAVRFVRGGRKNDKINPAADMV